MNDIFLNIIILFSPNYEKKKEYGTVIKSIPLIKQLITFYKSIKKNLKLIKYDISIVHYRDFIKEDMDKLNKIDINLYKIDTNDIRECAINRYIIKTKIKGTHRLIAETDMLLLKEPKFNWECDVQMMYAGTTPFDINTMNKIYECFDIKNKYKNNYFNNKDLFLSYNIKKIKKNKIYPHFNNGLMLFKEDFAKKFYEKIISVNLFNILDNKFTKKIAHYGPQVIFSLLLVELTNNWEPFEAGINYLPQCYDVKLFGIENIILIHYCGTAGLNTYDYYIKNNFGKYFE